MSDILHEIKKAQKEIRKEGHAGWGNLLDEVITEIERLRGGWISVKDRLPEHNGTILLYVDMGNDCDPIICTGFQSEYDEQFRIWDENGRGNEENITRWMEIPIPTQEPK